MMDFTLPLLQTNKRWNLRDEAAGRPVMLTFWTSWCPDSFRDLQEKKILFQHADPSKLCFITVNVTGREGDVQLTDFVQKHELPYEVLCDNGTEVYDRFNCSGVPTTVFLDKELNVVQTLGDQARITDVMTGLTAIIDK